MVTDLLRAVVLGVVEGATEFLPISSTGHLIVAGHWMGFVGPRADLFEIVIQLGAILAVVWEYRAKLTAMAIDLRGHPADPRVQNARRLLIALAVAFLPAAIVGFRTHAWITAHLFRPTVVAWALIVGGVFMWLVEARPRVARVHTTMDISPPVALAIGVMQVASLVPGVSRSASTIIGALMLGVERPAAAEFSFLLAIPIMIAATGLGLITSPGVLHSSDVPLFVTGFLSAFASALVAIRVLLRIVRRHDFRPFAVYRIAFGGFLLLSVARGWFPA